MQAGTQTHGIPLGVWVFIASALGQLASVMLWTPIAGAHTIWFPGAVLLSSLLIADRRQWPACVVSAWLGVILVAACFGLSPLDTGLVVVAPLLATCPVAWWLLRSGNGRVLDEFAHVRRFLLAAAVVAVVGSLLVAWLSSFTVLAGAVLGDWSNIAMSHALGYVLVVPLAITVVGERRDFIPNSATARDATVIGLATVIVLTGWWWLAQLPAARPMLVLLPIPLVLWATFRFRILGCCAVVLVLTAIAAHLGLNDRGPFQQAAIAGTTIAVQAWALALNVSALFFATLIEQRRAARRALSASHGEVRQLAGRLIVTQEHERSRIAADLHDDLDQQASAIANRLGLLRQRAAPDDRMEIDVVTELVVMLSEDIRRLSDELHPSRLRQTGLHEALRALCDACDTSIDIQLRLPPFADDYADRNAQAVFETARAALDNVASHARASRVVVALERTDSELVLQVEDDGCGFVPDTRAGHAREGMGLVGMEERARQLRGTLAIASKPGSGCRLVLRLPLQP